MNKLIFFSLLILTTSIYAADDEDVLAIDSTPVITSMTEKAEEPRIFNAYKSHWITTFGFETGRYEVPWEFDGDEETIRPGDQSLSGGRIGFGREIYLGKGVMTATKVEGYYIGTLFTKAKNAGPEDGDIEYDSIKRTGHLWGIDATQTLSYLFEMKTKNPVMGEWTYLTVEPYVEAGIGKASAYQRIKYEHLLEVTREYYRHSISDDLTNAKIGAGINFTSRQGYFLFLKVTQNRYDITERKVNQRHRENGGVEDSIKRTDKNVDIDAITIYSLGGGYKF